MSETIGREFLGQKVIIRTYTEEAIKSIDTCEDVEAE